MTLPAEGWRDRAACARVDPEVFFPPKGGSSKAAKEVCQGCEVKLPCLNYALQRNTVGVWGGMSERERNKLLRMSA